MEPYAGVTTSLGIQTEILKTKRRQKDTRAEPMHMSNMKFCVLHIQSCFYAIRSKNGKGKGGNENENEIMQE